MLKKLKENILASSYEDRAGRSVISVKTLMEIIDRLAAEQPEDYQPREEQGLLIELPCKEDSKVWYLDKYDYEKPEVVGGVVDGYIWRRSCGFTLDIVWDKPIMGHFAYVRKDIPFSEIGKTVFLTRSEAEEALAKMGGKL